MPSFTTVSSDKVAIMIIVFTRDILRVYIYTLKCGLMMVIVIASHQVACETEKPAKLFIYERKDNKCFEPHNDFS